jgi:hypothetical protein
MEKMSWTDFVKNEEVLQSKGGKEHPKCSMTKEG